MRLHNGRTNCPSVEYDKHNQKYKYFTKLSSSPATVSNDKKVPHDTPVSRRSLEGKNHMLI